MKTTHEQKIKITFRWQWKSTSGFLDTDIDINIDIDISIYVLIDIINSQKRKEKIEGRRRIASSCFFQVPALLNETQKGCPLLAPSCRKRHFCTNQTRKESPRNGTFFTSITFHSVKKLRSGTLFSPVCLVLPRAREHSIPSSPGTCAQKRCSSASTQGGGGGTLPARGHWATLGDNLGVRGRVRYWDPGSRPGALLTSCCAQDIPRRRRTPPQTAPNASGGQ